MGPLIHLVGWQSSRGPPPLFASSCASESWRMGRSRSTGSSTTARTRSCSAPSSTAASPSGASTAVARHSCTNRVSFGPKASRPPLSARARRALQRAGSGSSARCRPRRRGRCYPRRLLGRRSRLLRRWCGPTTCTLTAGRLATWTRTRRPPATRPSAGSLSSFHLLCA